MPTRGLARLAVAVAAAAADALPVCLRTLAPPCPPPQVWELIICDPQRSFEYAQYYPNNKINSGEVGACFAAPPPQPLPLACPC